MPSLVFQVSVDGRPRHVAVSPTGLTIDGRAIPWESVVDIPAAWHVVCDGWVISTHATERRALDAAADARAAGGRADVVRVPAG